MILNKRELATVLFALRHLVSNLDGEVEEIMAESEHFHGLTPMSESEIDVLCERINCDHVTGLPSDAVISRVIRDDDFSFDGITTIADLIEAGGSFIDGHMDPPVLLFQVEGDERYWAATIEMHIDEANPEFVKDSLAEEEDE